ncbi:MAG: hypothetical protein LKJ13_01810 [Clostridia bacterium]|jgi:hypothetical protein|nr:hypothetical protein [Clostridia bacterium]MCI1999014.1 hypothetical protein [Clostridia bacterium]MCI2013764.1 hypothetical protein [Clostridia bacterium]
MKCDNEIDDKIADLYCAAAKCRQVLADLSVMLDEEDDKYLVWTRDRKSTYADIALDYAVQLDKGLDDICKNSEIIKNAPAPTTAQGATKTTSSLTQEE